MDNSRESKVRVNKIQIHGLDITRDDLVEAVLAEVLEAQTLGAVVDRVQAACARFRELDIFQVVDVVLDVPREAWAPAHAVDVVLNVREKSRLRLSTGTQFGAQEGNLVRDAARPDGAAVSAADAPCLRRLFASPPLSVSALPCLTVTTDGEDRRRAPPFAMFWAAASASK